MDKNLLVFTRNPELGKVKSRLAKSIGKENALAVYNILLAHTHKTTKDLAVKKHVYYSNEIPAKDIWGTEFEKKQQHGKDLGERMHNAFTESFDAGYKKTILIGSDLLEISTELINEAFDLLEENDVVIGPALDGGYYLIGMKKECKGLFENKQWGTNTVYEQSTESIIQNSLNFKALKTLNDIDIVEDLKGNSIFNKYLK